MRHKPFLERQARAFHIAGFKRLMRVDEDAFHVGLNHVQSIVGRFIGFGFSFLGRFVFHLFEIGTGQRVVGVQLQHALIGFARHFGLAAAEKAHAHGEQVICIIRLQFHKLGEGAARIIKAFLLKIQFAKIPQHLGIVRVNFHCETERGFKFVIAIRRLRRHGEAGVSGGIARLQLNDPAKLQPRFLKAFQLKQLRAKRFDKHGVVRFHKYSSLQLGDSGFRIACIQKKFRLPHRVIRFGIGGFDFRLGFDDGFRRRFSVGLGVALFDHLQIFAGNFVFRIKLHQLPVRVGRLFGIARFVLANRQRVQQAGRYFAIGGDAVVNFLRRYTVAREERIITKQHHRLMVFRLQIQRRDEACLEGFAVVRVEC